MPSCGRTRQDAAPQVIKVRIALYAFGAEDYNRVVIVADARILRFGADQRLMLLLQGTSHHDEECNFLMMRDIMPFVLIRGRTRARRAC
jgi:hypothetical protein